MIVPLNTLLKRIDLSSKLNGNSGGGSGGGGGVGGFLGFLLAINAYLYALDLTYSLPSPSYQTIG